MKGILVVDDSKTNRMVLKAVISDYLQESAQSCEVLEAENGQEAVEKVAQNAIDLVFMDIMMPVMDGIEATRQIKEQNKKTMVVAVSALDDEENKKEILKKGAEDYIVKPISNEVVKRRLAQYASLVNARKQKKFSSHATNLIDHRVYHRKLVFFVENEASLSEFWDYYLMGAKEHADELTDLVRIIFGFAAWQLKLKHSLEITVEESDETLFFTMNRMKLLKQEIVENVIKRNYPSGQYKMSDDLLSFALSKEDQQPEASASPQEEMAVSQPDAVAVEVPDVEIPQEPVELHVFDFMDTEDLEELESVFSEINSLMLLVGSSSLEEKEVCEIAAYLEKFARILNQYPETYQLHAAIASLAGDIQTHADKFIEKSKEISLLCAGFNNDLGTWVQKIFYDGAPSVDFLDSSIISNAQMISSFINPQEGAAAEVDDIFDF